ncbi:MAG: tetratricopeptide repeat protein [Balneolaceae bacterium]|nr:MAG: tetratricopeptide repeat protein [Balneolaceae bacterium]
MQLELHQIPVSYQSYAEQFDSNPALAISRLESRIEKRNPGAVGYLILAWFYLKNSDREKALEAALTARILAPGSSFMSRLPYFVRHPKAFDAWQPAAVRVKQKDGFQLQDESHPIKDLDLLISKLSSIGTARLESANPEYSDVDLSNPGSEVDDIVTETLAVIHEKQNNYEEAISTYEKLLKEKPHKKETFKKKIEKLNLLKAKSGKSSKPE